MNTKELKKYVVTSAVAGIVISLALFVYFAVMHYTGNKIVAALAFSTGLVFCTFLGADLFTSKTFVFSADVFKKEKKPLSAARLMLFILLFNLVGAVLISGLFVLSQPADGIKEIAGNYAIAKADLQFWVVFVRAVLCNFFVCTGTYFAIKFKDNAAVAIILIMICVAPFVVLSFEHSVANIGAFSFAFMAGFKLPFLKVLLNLVFAVLGNFVGGLCIALYHKLRSFEF